MKRSLASVSASILALGLFMMLIGLLSGCRGTSVPATRTAEPVEGGSSEPDMVAESGAIRVEATVPATKAVEPVEGQNWTSPATGMEFVWIEQMGLWVGKFEVTNGEYRRKEPRHDSRSYGSRSLNHDRQPGYM